MNSKYLIGIGFKLLNCLLFSVLSLVVVYCAKTMPVAQILFARVFLGAIICAIYLLAIKQPIPLTMSKKDFLLYLARAVISFVAMQLWVIAIDQIGINEATALSYTGPFWIFLSARYVVGEAFNKSSLVVILINVIGMFLILQPKLNDLNLYGVVASLGSILLWVIYETICKKQTTTQHYMLQTFYVSAIAIVLIMPFALYTWQEINLQVWGILGLVAMLGVVNITVMFIAYSFAPMMVISPFNYARLIFTAVLTAWLYNITPHIQVFIGAAIIMITNGYFAYYSHKTQR